MCISTFGNFCEDVVKSLWDDSPEFRRILLALHGESLATACLSIGKDCSCATGTDTISSKLVFTLAAMGDSACDASVTCLLLQVKVQYHCSHSEQHQR